MPWNLSENGCIRHLAISHGMRVAERHRLRSSVAPRLRFLGGTAKERMHPPRPVANCRSLRRLRQFWGAAPYFTEYNNRSHDEQNVGVPVSICTAICGVRLT